MQAWPGRRWTLAPASEDVDAAALGAAVQRHLQRPTAGVHAMRAYLGQILADQPYRQILGPLKDGAGPSGVCVHRGELIAQWGDPGAVEMSFSVTKTYLSILAGIAVDDHLIGAVDDAVARTVDHPAFAGPRHVAITWRHLLQQTSEWAGTLWDVPWWADPQGGQGPDHPLGPPGTSWAYNDVRINLLALALLVVFGTPLPQVLQARVMEPLEASGTWSGTATPTPGAS